MIYRYFAKWQSGNHRNIYNKIPLMESFYKNELIADIFLQILWNSLFIEHLRVDISVCFTGSGNKFFKLSFLK